MKPWMAAVLVTMLGAACAPPQSLPPDVRPGLATSAWSGPCGLKWPPDDGFAGPAVLEQLQAGTLIDRFGSPYGTFFSPVGASYRSRALPYVCESKAYTVYRLDVPLRVQAGKAAPWFNEPGGATQFMTYVTAADLAANGLITVEKYEPAGAPDADHRCQ